MNDYPLRFSLLHLTPRSLEHYKNKQAAATKNEDIYAARYPLRHTRF